MLDIIRYIFYVAYLPLPSRLHQMNIVLLNSINLKKSIKTIYSLFIFCISLSTDKHAGFKPLPLN